MLPDQQRHKWTRQRWTLVLAFAGVSFLYLFGLTRTGLLGPDEPRYAAIGQAMAETGDWVTPKLWGKPWFEKPPLLYWMTAAGFKAGLGQDLAPRLPVAIVSLAFLIFFFNTLRREFGQRSGFYATTILATSAGWLAYSHVAVTDLPMSAAFSAAMLIVLREGHGPRASILAGVLLGLAILGKGLVPLALFLPAIWFLRHRLRELLLIFAAAALIAAPWYVLITWRNGMPFLEEFFGRHHFARFASATIGHGRPFWFYLPVLLAGIFPWTPFLALLFQRRSYTDRRNVFLLAWILWGLVFFSAFLNKLPGYLLPLIPAVAALLGILLADARERSAKISVLLAASAALLWCVPAIQDILPQALLNGMSRTHVQVPVVWILPALLFIGICILLDRSGRRGISVTLIGLVTALSVVRLVWQIYPTLDQLYSARGFWVSHAGSITCVPKQSRALEYGIRYYSGRDLPDCN